MKKSTDGKQCVRRPGNEPSPFTKKCLAVIMTHMATEYESPGRSLVVDIGCGNGRNIERFGECGFRTLAFDMKPDYGKRLMLGKDRIPVGDMDAEIVIANYSMMFVPKGEIRQVLGEIRRILSPGGMFIWELYPAKSSFCRTEAQISALNRYLGRFCTDSLDFYKVFHTGRRGFFTGTKLSVWGLRNGI